MSMKLSELGSRSESGSGSGPGPELVLDSGGLGGIGLNVVQGARLAGANMIVGIDLNPARKEMAENFGMTHFVNPSEIDGDIVPYLVDLTGGGADYCSNSGTGGDFGVDVNSCDIVHDAADLQSCLVL